MPTTLMHRLRAAIKSFNQGEAIKSFNQGDWVNSSRPGNIYSSAARSHCVPGTVVNWDGVTGELWTCPAVQACLNWINRNFPQAPPIVRQRNGETGQWTIVPDHALTRLLRRPNPEYDWNLLSQAIVLSLETNGNAYCAIERNNGLQPAELWWMPHHLVTAVTEAGSRNFIDRYEVSVRGKKLQVDPRDMLHVRYGLDPDDVRLGLSPLASAKRGVYSLQQANTYRANILRNSGAIGVLISSKLNSQKEWDPAELVEKYKAKVTGDAVGEAFATDAELDFTFPRNSPEDMAMEIIEDRPESEVCALVGIPPQVAGLHVGRLSKTYANMEQARESAWEEKLMPLGTMLGSQIGYKLLAELSEEPTEAAKMEEAGTLALGFDYSNVRPLQPDMDLLHERVRRDWLANLITLADWKRAVDRLPDPGDEKLRYRDFANTPQTELAVTPAPGKSAGRPYDWSQRIIEEIETMHGYGENRPSR